MSSQNHDGCILAAEVAGDSKLLSRLGETETARAIERCRNRAERAIEAHLGVPLLANGRRVLAHFPKSDSAILAALDMRERVAQLPPVSGTKFFVRIVVHATPQAHSQADNAMQTARDDALAIAGTIGDNLIMVSEEATTLLSDTVRHQLDLDSPSAVPGVASAKKLFPLVSDQTPPEKASPAPFAPTSTSISIEPSAFDTTTHSQSPHFGPAAHTEQRATLIVRHMGSSFMVGDSRPVLLAGREEGNDLVIGDRRASRHHARIEWRQSRFVLIDTSTNGTYMVDDAGTEVVLRRHEAELPAQGRIGFGFSPLEADTEAVAFTINQR